MKRTLTMLVSIPKKENLKQQQEGFPQQQQEMQQQQQQKLKMNQHQRNPRKKLLEVQRAVTMRMGSSFRRTWGEQMERVSTLASLSCSTLSSTTSIPTLRATAWGTTSLRVFRWILLSFYVIHLLRPSAQVLVHSPYEFAEVIIDNIMVYVQMLTGEWERNCSWDRHRSQHRSLRPSDQIVRMDGLRENQIRKGQIF